MSPTVQRVLTLLAAAVLAVSSYTVLAGTSYAAPVLAAGAYLVGLLFPQLGGKLKGVLAFCLVMPALSACSGDQSSEQGAEVVKLVHRQLAEALCAREQAQAQGVELEQARSLYCQHGDALERALLQVLADPQSVVAVISAVPAGMSASSVPCAPAGGAPSAPAAGGGAGG